MRSVGIERATQHTDSPVTLDLSPIRAQIDDIPLGELTANAADAAAEYLGKRGFVDAGELMPLDGTYVASSELRAVGAELSREIRPTEGEELYFLDLLAGADEGERPPPEAVPTAFRCVHGLSMATAVGDYQRDVRLVYEDYHTPEASRLAGTIRDHTKRIEALDGDVDPKNADRLVHAIRDLGTYLRTDEESALVTADNWIQGI